MSASMHGHDEKCFALLKQSKWPADMVQISIEVTRLHQWEVGSTSRFQRYVNAAVILSWLKQTKLCQNYANAVYAYAAHAKYTSTWVMFIFLPAS